jgi:hypothetical protein
MCFFAGKLPGQIAPTTQQLQAATTDAETQKLTGVLVGYTAELEAVDREIDHAAAQVATQDAENRTDVSVRRSSPRERQAEMEEASADIVKCSGSNELTHLPTRY